MLHWVIDINKKQMYQWVFCMFNGYFVCYTGYFVCFTGLFTSTKITGVFQLKRSFVAAFFFVQVILWVCQLD